MAITFAIRKAIRALRKIWWPEFDGRKRFSPSSMAAPRVVRGPRARWILLSWREYQRYARGPIAMVSDAFIVSGEKAAGKAGQNT
jgi:hypothetical protein